MALADRTLRCWGDNYFGQLGNGIAGFYTTPVPTLGYSALAWNSGSPSVAVVDAIGRVSALSAGSALIAASLNGFNASTTVTVQTVPGDQAGLALTLTDSPDPVKKGAKLTYTLSVKNKGPKTAQNVVLTDTLPPNIMLISITKTQGSCSDTATVTCAIGTLNSGATATVKIAIKPMTVGTISNSASVNATQGDPNIANNKATVTTLVHR